MAFRFDTLLGLASGAVIAVIGVGILLLHSDRKGGRVFSFFLLAWAAQIVSANLFAALENRLAAELAMFGNIVFHVLDGALLAWFIAEFPEARSRAWRILGYAYAGAAILVALAFAWDPAGFATLSLVEGGLRFEPRVGYTVGILMSFAAFYLAAIALAISYVKPASKLQRTETAIALGAILLYLGHATTYNFAFFASGRSFIPWGSPSRFVEANVAIFALGLLALGAIGVALARTALRDKTRSAWWLLAALGSGVAVAALLVPVVGGANARVTGAFRILAALLIAYGVVKHQVFDIDLKVKAGIRRGTLGAVFVATFFVAGQLAENFIQDQTGSFLVAFVFAAVMLVVENRIMHLGSRVADKALPKVEPTTAYLAERGRVVYRAALESATRDGVITERERDMLSTLKREFGISDEESSRMEREVLRGAAA